MKLFDRTRIVIADSYVQFLRPLDLSLNISELLWVSL